MDKQVKLDKDAIDNERAALLLLVDEIQKTTDDDEREALAEAIQAQANKLQSMCDDLQAQADEIMKSQEKDPNLNVFVEVVLTPEQRARVLEATGVDVPSVKIPDPTAELTKNMAYIKPDYIEQRAMLQAENFKRLLEDMEVDGESEDDTEGEENGEQ